MHINPDNPPEGVDVSTDFITGGQSVTGKIGFWTTAPDQELFLAGNWVSRKVMEDAYGNPDDLAKILAENVTAGLVREIRDRIIELRESPRRPPIEERR
jgi:hypothetical protein